MVICFRVVFNATFRITAKSMGLILDKKFRGKIIKSISTPQY